MGFMDFIAGEFERDPLLRFGRKIFTRRAVTRDNESMRHYKKARSLLHYKSKNFDLRLAIEHLKEAIRIAPKNAYYHCVLGQALLLAPSFAVVHGDNGGLSLSRCVEIAIHEFGESIKNDPEYIWAYYYMAVGYEYLGQNEKAKEKCREALKVFPTGESKNLLENYLSSLEAPPADDVVIAEMETESLSHLELAVVYQREGKRKLAFKEFEKGCALAPTSSWLYRTLCQLSSRK